MGNNLSIFQISLSDNDHLMTIEIGFRVAADSKKIFDAIVVLAEANMTGDDMRLDIKCKNREVFKAIESLLADKFIKITQIIAE